MKVRANFLHRTIVKSKNGPVIGKYGIYSTPRHSRKPPISRRSSSAKKPNQQFTVTFFRIHAQKLAVLTLNSNCRFAALSEGILNHLP